MCLICEKVKKNQMTLNEARKNIIELRIFDHIDDEHYAQIIDMISDVQRAEDEEKVKSIFNK